MNYTVERTEDDIIIRFPRDTMDGSVQNVLDYLEFLVLSQGSQAGEQRVVQSVREVKDRVWEQSSERLRNNENSKADGRE